MKIVIDLQGAQTESQYRGIGRQAKMLATSLISHANAHDIDILLNSGLRENIEGVTKYFRGLVPASQIKFFDIPGAVLERDIDNMWRMRAAELAREACIAELRPDVVYLSSLFEGVNDNAVTSIGLMQASHATAVTLFDLIPLYDETAYLGSDFMRRFYFRRAQSLKRADLLLAISQSARREAVEMLQIPEERIDVALLAADANFRKTSLPHEDEVLLRAKYDLPKSFILYVGAIEPRKNVVSIIEAFAKLPAEMQRRHAIVFGGKLNDPERLQLRAAAFRFGVDPSRLVFPGFIAESDLAAIYSLCDLFVFPSIQEGFGLPPLEAMACGAPVLSARNSSLPEVMGRDDLLFGTFDADELATKMQKILTDQVYSASIRQWGLDRAAEFTWEETGRLALDSIERLHERHSHTSRTVVMLERRPRLAFFSPLPSDRSGVADYSADLLRELGRFYDIECIIQGTHVNDSWILANFALRDVAFFKRHANSYDRIVYSIGNSAFHEHMFDLLADFPGIVILHDFFLSGVFDWLGNVRKRPSEDFLRQLYRTHGLPALQHVKAKGRDETAKIFPANGIVFEHAFGVIVHSHWAVSQAECLYGSEISQKVVQIPQLRGAFPTKDRRDVRRRLGIEPNAFVVCSFGFVSTTKLSDRLFDAWATCKAARSQNASLIYVGENIGGAWGEALERKMDDDRGVVAAEVSGYVNAAVYQDYLVAADIAVQLRTNSRGETSRAILDCMAAGLPVIVNAHGTAVELPDTVVLKIRDDFTTAELAGAIDALFTDAAKRSSLAQRGRDEIRARHHPSVVGEQIFAEIERFHRISCGGIQTRLLDALTELSAPVSPSEHDIERLSRSVARNRARIGFRRVLYDVTLLSEHDSHTGIERVVRSMLAQLIEHPPAKYRVEPVRIDGGQLRFAREFVSRKMGIPADVLPDSVVDYDRGDIYVMLEWAADRLPQIVEWLQAFRRGGGRVVIGINDLLPLLIPHRFPPHLGGIAERWFDSTLRVADQLICISRCVADDVLRLGNALSERKNTPIAVDYYHCAYDIKSSVPTTGLPGNAKALLATLKKRNAFLMVGTVEPRKGHLQTVQAFQALWAKGADVSLIIVGKKGWMVDEVARKVDRSSERDKRLFWFTGISDEFLELLYANCTALIAASEAEGFGLPLVEAASHGLPLIARDIPVFREVAGDHAFYFDAKTPAELAAEIDRWLLLTRKNQVPESSKLPILSWREASQQFIAALFGDRHYGWIGSDMELKSTTSAKVGEMDAPV